MKVAFIGVGTMGKPMAANIVKAGHQVSVFDASLDTAREVAAEIGAAVLTDLSGTVDCEFIVTMLPDGHVVRAVALGEGGVGSWARAGTIFIDMSSSQPLVTQSTGAERDALGSGADMSKALLAWR
jgi:3-hydroxyisobutyrate dehydrogenase-like beta-hydroxyacid dehydrogenase